MLSLLNYPLSLLLLLLNPLLLLMLLLLIHWSSPLPLQLVCSHQHDRRLRSPGELRDDRLPDETPHGQWPPWCDQLMMP